MTIFLDLPESRLYLEGEGRVVVSSFLVVRLSLFSLEVAACS
jgi:hypothetical protein